jgi:predicted house-cleaning noncanonical NTP pyrophosphatase (MazG superfamily)
VTSFQIIQADRHRAVTHVLDEETYRAALLEKLTEEAHEARQAPAVQLAELADVLEVLHAIAETYSLSWSQILEIATRKRTKREVFNDRIFLEYVEEGE